MSDPTVRPAQPSDTPEIVELAERAWRATYGDILDAETIEAAIAEWYTPQGTRRAIEAEEVGYFVAVDSDIIGYASGHCEDSTAQLSAIYVDPDHWGEGVGTQLLDRFEQFCAEAGCETITIQVHAENEIGVSFYRARGYSPVVAEKTELFGENIRETTFRGEIRG